MGMDIHRVVPGSAVDLRAIDTAGTAGFDGGKDEANRTLAGLTIRLSELQELMYAEGKRRVLVVLQAMDTGGKDGAIRGVFGKVNPQGVKVASFKRPTPEDLAHDYLWRIHPHVPGNGEITIFNRSHYEDVLVVRVRALAPEPVWSRRYDHINAFEKLLADEGTTILKFYLHISKDEQKSRLQARLDDPNKHWKFDSGDLAERALWDDYIEAFRVALERTSTAAAPWYVVPSDRKWYRNVVIAQTIVDTLEGLHMKYPASDEDLSAIVIE